MTHEVITSLEQLNPGWLTAALLDSGGLTSGSVEAFDSDTGVGNWSDNIILHLRYAQGSEGPMPPRLFLKMVDAEASSSDEFFGISEVTYYTRDYVDVPDAPLVRCYSAAYSTEGRRYHLLLDDVSETHAEAASRTPTLEYGLALAEGLAAMHARWWGAQRLNEVGAPMHSAEHIRRFAAIAEPSAGHIIARFSADLAPHWPEVMENLFAQFPAALVERAEDDNGFTLIHGDVGHNNVLVPRDGHRPIYIIDRQPFNWSLTTWLGVYDLAYAMVLDWDVPTRRRLEMEILRHYHLHLRKYGVRGYTWEQLVSDYRLTAAMGAYIATEYCRGGINERRVSVWLPMLKRALTVIDDLKCADLWS